jgi:hypothetical protein
MKNSGSEYWSTRYTDDQINNLANAVASLVDENAGSVLKRLVFEIAFKHDSIASSINRELVPIIKKIKGE